MPRLSRAERQVQTAADILASAKKKFLNSGYAATSVDEVAEDAGYSKGAVYSNFRDKPTLCRAVLEAIHREKLAELADISTSGADLKERITDFETWIESTAGDIAWTMLELEFVVLSRHDPELGAMIIALREDAEKTVETILESLLSGPDMASHPRTALPVPLSEVANVLLSVGIGLGIQRAVDPSVSIQAAMSALSTALTFAIGSGRDGTV